jgi:hypothetical protein
MIDLDREALLVGVKRCEEVELAQAMALAEKANAGED